MEKPKNDEGDSPKIDPKHLYSELFYIGEEARQRLISIVAEAYCNHKEWESREIITEILVSLARVPGVDVTVVPPRGKPYFFAADDEDYSVADDLEALDFPGGLSIDFDPDIRSALTADDDAEPDCEPWKVEHTATGDPFDPVAEEKACDALGIEKARSWLTALGFVCQPQTDKPWIILEPNDRNWHADEDNLRGDVVDLFAVALKVCRTMAAWKILSITRDDKQGYYAPKSVIELVRARLQERKDSHPGAPQSEPSA